MFISWIYEEAVGKNQDKSALIELFKQVLDNEEQSLQLANRLFSTIAVKYRRLADCASLELPVGADNATTDALVA